MKVQRPVPLELEEQGAEARRFRAFAEPRIRGQPRIIDALAAVVERVSAGFHNGEKPYASMLLVGPSGVGKTFAAKVLAEFFFGDPRGFIRLDGQQFSERHEVAKLFGSPPGYIGYYDKPMITQEKLDGPAWNADVRRFRESLKGENRKLFDHLWREYADTAYQRELEEKKGGKADQKLLGSLQAKLDEITERVRGLGYPQYDPYGGRYRSILLLDELERAHHEFHNALFSILDEGVLELARQPAEEEASAVGRVRFGGTVIVATSNIASDKITHELRIMRGTEVRLGIGSEAPLSGDALDERIYDMCRAELDKQFETAFLNRFGTIVAARPLPPDVMMQILDDQIRALAVTLANEWRFPVALIVTNDARRFILKKATDRPEEGARLLHKKMEHYLINALARFKNTEQIKPGDAVRVQVRRTAHGDELKFEMEPAEVRRIPIVPPSSQ